MKRDLTELERRNADRLASQGDDQAARAVTQAAMRATETKAPFYAPEGLQHITPEELQLIALFRRNDERGQKLTFRIVTLHAVEYPRD